VGGEGGSQLRRSPSSSPRKKKSRAKGTEHSEKSVFIYKQNIDILEKSVYVYKQNIDILAKSVPRAKPKRVAQTHTYTHTHTRAHTHTYIQREREREREVNTYI
jgi:NAD-dependent SIR2 family protein deacetylase